MLLRKCIVLFLICMTPSFGQKDPHFWPDRNTIVHLFEWKWADIANECENFLQHKGYGGVQVSPPNENVIINNRPWWERYQPVSYKINTRSGDEEAFKGMTQRCNAVGVRIYVDTVINHMSATTGNGTDGHTSDSTSRFYPAVPYNNTDFHEPCSIDDFQNAEIVRNCELVGLPDLDQSKEYVRQKMVDYLNYLIDLGVAGFRIDAAKHMWPSDLENIFSRLQNLNTNYGFDKDARAFIFQEVSDLGGEAISACEYTDFGRVIEFKYSNNLGKVFHGNDKLTYLANWGAEWGLIDSSNALAFIDNHDNQRTGDNVTLTYKEPKQYKMAIAFMLAHPYGVTRIMSSFDFSNTDQGPPSDDNGDNILSPQINDDDTCSNGWICEHRWRQIYNMVGFRNAVKDTEIREWWSNGDQQIAFCRGNKGFIALTNYGDIKNKLQTCVPSGKYCDIISGNLVDGSCTGKVVQVDDNGYADITLEASESDGVLAIYINIKEN